MTFTPRESQSRTGDKPAPLAPRVSFTTVEIVFAVLAAGLSFLSEQFSLPFLTNPALLFAGLVMATLGIEQVVTRLDIYRGGWSFAQIVEIYRTLVVQLWGLIFIGLGLLLAARAVLGWLDPRSADSLLDGFFNSPSAIGLIVAAIGLLTALHGLIRALAGSSGTEQATITGVRDALDRLAGVAILLFGLALSFVGLVVGLAPTFLTSIISQLGTTVVGP